MVVSAFADTYWQYIQRGNLTLSADTVARITALLQQTNWEEPLSPLEHNNCAVVALIEAESAEDIAIRQTYLDLAIASLTQHANAHPLCAAHLAIVQSLVGFTEEASQAAFSQFMSLLTLREPSIADDESDHQVPPGLIYLPSCWQSYLEDSYAALSKALESQSGIQQSLGMLAEVLDQSQLVLYSAAGQRFLQLNAQLSLNSVAKTVRLGIANLFNYQWEGLLYLHRAHQQRPDHPTILHAVYLAYLSMQQPDVALRWQTKAQQHSAYRSDTAAWQWMTLSPTDPATIVPYDGLSLVVEPNFRSIVTTVLLAEGDWFEQEMEFWREAVQPGMTVIDVGANVGVYTFSAAQRVGETGRVFAVEPFSGCVRCLEATCQINQLSWVKVCRGAAGDRMGTARLSLHSASELSAIVPTDADTSTEKALSESASDRDAPFEAVPCFTLDRLVEQERISQVHLLKIDAEGQELAVLTGSQRILNDFSPIILYENLAGNQPANEPVAEFLWNQGYTLFYYQPFIKQLVKIDSYDQLQNRLNIIARVVVSVH